MSADSRIARRSTWVDPQGTQIKMRGLGLNSLRLWTFSIKNRNIFSVILKSAITPSFSGRIAVILPGVRPNICLASAPTAAMVLAPRTLSSLIATTDGSLSTIP